MTLAELKKEAIQLPLMERYELQSYRAGFDQGHEAEFHRIASQRMKRMDQGDKTGLSDLEARHEALKTPSRNEQSLRA